MKLKSTIIFGIFLVLFKLTIGCTNKVPQKHPATIITEKYIASSEDIKRSFPERIQLCDSAFEELKKLENDSLVCRAVLRLGWSYRELYRMDKLKETSVYAKKLSEEAQDSVYRGFAYKSLGSYYTATSQNDSALHWFAKSKEMIGKSKKPRYVLGLMYDVANVEFYMGDFAGAEAGFTKLLKLARETKKYDYEYLALFYLGAIANDLGEYKKAESYAKQSLSAVLNHPDTTVTYVEAVYSNLGYNSYLQKDYGKAQAYYEKAFTLLKNPNRDPDGYVQLLDYMGSIKLKKREFTQAKALFDKAYAFRKEKGIEQGSNYNRLNLAQYYLAKHDTAAAIPLAEEALRISKTFRSPNDIVNVLKVLVKIDNRRGSPYLDEYVRVTDSIQIAERRNKNRFARIVFETDQLAAEKKQAIKTMWLIILCATLVVIFILLLVLIRLNSIKEKELAFEREQQKFDEGMYRLIHDQQERIDAARKTEKAKIAKELHDGIMNSLSAIRLNLFVLTKKRDDQTIDRCLDYINEIQKVEMELRSVSHDLSTQDSKWENGFGELLANFYNDQRDIVASNIHMEIDAIDWSVVGNEVKINIFRILQETVGNAAKYSEARDIWISIRNKNGKVSITVKDNGVGFNLKKSLSGLGLKSIRERVKGLEGSIDIQSEIEKGTAIEITI